MKKLFFMIIVSSLLMTGCRRKLVSEEIVIHSVTVSEVEYTPSSTYTIFTRVGHIMVPMKRTRPESYLVVFDYRGVKISYNEKDIYNEFKDKLNKNIECEMNIKVYDDNSFDVKILNFIGSDNND